MNHSHCASGRLALVAVVLVAGVTRAPGQSLVTPNFLETKDQIEAMSVSPDGKTLAVLGDTFKGIGLFDVGTGKRIGVLSHPGGAQPAMIAWTPNGRFLVNSGGDLSDTPTLALVYDVAGRKLHKEFRMPAGHALFAETVAVVDDKTLLAGGNIDAGLYDLSTGKHLGDIKDTAKVLRLTTSAGGRWLLVGGIDRGLRLYDLRRRAFVHLLHEHTSPIHAVAISPDSKWCAAGTFDRRLWVFDLETGKELGRTPTYVQFFRSLRFTPDGKTLVAAGCGADNGIALWDWQESKFIRGGFLEMTARGGFERASRDIGGGMEAALTPDGKTLFLAVDRSKEGRDGVYSVQKWDIPGRGVKKR